VGIFTLMRRKKQSTTKRRSASKRNLGKYNSGLEKSCAELLQLNRVPFDYEKTKYVLQEKFRHNGVYFKMTPKAKDLKDRTATIIQDIKYTPDFVAKDKSWIIETKGFVHSHHDFPMRWKLFLKHLNDSGEDLPMLFICKNKQQIIQAIEIIKENEQ
jgi:hypothetical protein